MKITIAHLYYDLLNLYGESGNVKALKQALETQNLEVQVKFLTLTDTLALDDVQIVYIGAGTEQNQKLALRHMMKQKDALWNAKEAGTFFLATGNAIELFGKSIFDQQEKKWKALHFFPYVAKEEPFRIVDEALFKTSMVSGYILGFQNQNSVIRNIKKPWFQVVKGTGSYPNSPTEGILEDHFYGTYLIGPLLVRNPALLEVLTKEIVSYYFPALEYQPLSLDLEQHAYDTFLEHYYKEFLIK